MPKTFFGWIGYIIKQYYPLFVSGTINTLLVSITGTIIGFLIGLLVAIVRTIPETESDSIIKRVLMKLGKAVSVVYIEVFRGTPMIVQAMVIYYGAAQYLKLYMKPFAAALFIISINTGAYMAEIIRGGIISVDSGQTEGALSIGMTHWQTMTKVVLPQAIRNIMPSLGNEFVVNIKDSSVLNVISFTEIFFQTKSAAGAYLRYFESFSIAAVIYFILTFTVTRLLRLLERKMDGPDSYVIYGSQSDGSAEIHVTENKK